jgi:hypothetical protein
MLQITTIFGPAFSIFCRLCKLAVLPACLLFSAQTAWSQAAPPRFSVGIYALAGQGKMGNGLADAPDRDMLHTPAGIFLGFNMKRFRLGINYEYNMVGQTTDTASVADTNLAGTSTAPGLRLEYYDGKNSFGAVYRVSDEYKLEKQTPGGLSSVYKGSGGFSVQYMRQLKGRVGLVLDYTSQEYSDSLSTGNIKWSRAGIGIVISNFGGAKGRR